MMKELSPPFNLVDFFAYLGNGFAAIAISYATSQAYHPSGYSPIVAQLAALNVLAAVPLLLFLSYAVGHAAAHISDIVFERLLVGKTLGHPRTYLLTKQSAKAKSWWRKTLVFVLGSPNYLRPFPDATLNDLKEKYEALYASQLGDSLEAERACFSFASEKNKTYSNRIGVFLAIYLFCRSASLVLACSALGIYLVAGIRELPLIVLLLVLSLLLLGRYLNFLRLYTRDIYIGFLTEPTRVN